MLTSAHRKPPPAAFVSTAAAAIVVLQAQEDQSWEDHLPPKRTQSSQTHRNIEQTVETLATFIETCSITETMFEIYKCFLQSGHLFSLQKLSRCFKNTYHIKQLIHVLR